MAPLVIALGAALAGFVGYKALTKPRYVGDLAKAGPVGTGPGTGDQVEVMVPDLMKGNASISIGTNPGQLPPGTNTVIVAVQGATKDVLQGPITTIGTVPLPVPIGNVVVNRADVKAVYRNGKIARNASGQFAGEKARRFAG